jgi:hypothetical protein
MFHRRFVSPPPKLSRFMRWPVSLDIVSPATNCSGGINNHISAGFYLDNDKTLIVVYCPGSKAEELAGKPVPGSLQTLNKSLAPEFRLCERSGMGATPPKKAGSAGIREYSRTRGFRCPPASPRRDLGSEEVPAQRPEDCSRELHDGDAPYGGEQWRARLYGQSRWFHLDRS